MIEKQLLYDYLKSVANGCRDNARSSKNQVARELWKARYDQAIEMHNWITRQGEAITEDVEHLKHHNYD